MKQLNEDYWNKAKKYLTMNDKVEQLLALGFRKEIMSPTFTKYHLEGLPFDAVLHHFTGVDEGDPHDHPFYFTSFVLKGGYTEKVFGFDGSFLQVVRLRGSSHIVSAKTIHQIIYVPKDCWTLILPEKWEREPCFWQFRDDGIYKRQWNEQNWTALAK